MYFILVKFKANLQSNLVDFRVFCSISTISVDFDPFNLGWSLHMCRFDQINDVRAPEKIFNALKFTSLKKRNKCFQIEFYPLKIPP